VAERRCWLRYGANSRRTSDGGARVLLYALVGVSELPLTGLVARIRSDEIGSLEATEAYLERIDRMDGRIRAYITVTAELAREQASGADEALARGETLGPLHGLPIALKDNIDTAGVRTTVGSAFFADQVPERDAEVARRLREAGAVLLGKVTLHEFAYGATNQNPHHGFCRNPWDLERIPGGSSGGSGAAVAAGLCATALGTDTGGSVRIPASLNGVSALRPTNGRVSNRGVFPITWTFDTVGPLARAAVDVALVFSVLAGFDPEDPGSVEHPPDDVLGRLDQGLEGLRIGVPGNFFFEEVDDEVADSVRAAADLMASRGAAVEEIELPGAERAHETTTRMIWAEAYAIHRRRLAEQPELFGEDVRRRLALGAEVSGADYAEYRQWAQQWRRTMERVFESVDLILTPAAGTTAPLAAESETIETTRRLTRLTYAWSLAGLPALAAPCGLDSAGLPIGLQLGAAPFREGTLLRAGAAYQRETDWHLREPALDLSENVNVG
jgi:aspartyl-tRNA(Asn)/glutamyl-tRNA(Gln) amidotransferase subunit A